MYKRITKRLFCYYHSLESEKNTNSIIVKRESDLSFPCADETIRVAMLSVEFLAENPSNKVSASMLAELEADFRQAVIGAKPVDKTINGVKAAAGVFAPDKRTGLFLFSAAASTPTPPQRFNRRPLEPQ